jgi:predicted RNase H-like nuclease
LQGGVPLSENKKTQAGYRQRMAILRARLGARAVTRLIDKLDAHPLRAGVARDDILDAMVCGYVARLDSKQLRALPEGGVEQNERGDAMQIWFPISLSRMCFELMKESDR